MKIYGIIKAADGSMREVELDQKIKITPPAAQEQMAIVREGRKRRNMTGLGEQGFSRVVIKKDLLL